MKSNQTIIGKNHMKQLHFITKPLDNKDTNIQIMDIVNRDTHKEIIAKLDYDVPSCPDCGSQIKNMTFKKRLKSLTLKQLACLLEPFLESVILSAIIAQNFDKLNIITVLKSRTQDTIRNHFLRYDKDVHCQMKIITMNL